VNVIIRNEYLVAIEAKYLCLISNNNYIIFARGFTRTGNIAIQKAEGIMCESVWIRNGCKTHKLHILELTYDN
jgi:hypothetical protein